jgi:glutamate-1-semialdehyde aminotransferase
MSRAEEFDLDDLDDLDRRMTKSDPIACVVTMPFEYEQSRPGHLEQVRTIVHSHGALLVLDEMRSGFRLSLGGAQDYLGVRADLTTFSKAMANGYAISAVTGSAEIMAGLASTKISSTFFANPADMAAALTTIHILAETDALDRIWTFGASLIAGLREIVAEAGIPAEVVGYPPMPFLRFTHADADDSDLARLTFFSETTKRGVLLHPDHQWFVSAAHSVADLDKTLSACRRGLLAAAAI